MLFRCTYFSIHCCSDLGVGGWVIGNPNIVRIFKIRTQKWTVPNIIIILFQTGFINCAVLKSVKYFFSTKPKKILFDIVSFRHSQNALRPPLKVEFNLYIA